MEHQKSGQLTRSRVIAALAALMVITLATRSYAYFQDQSTSPGASEPENAQPWRDLALAPQPQFDPWAYVPETFALATHVLDDEGLPIHNAKVWIGKALIGKSDRSGFINIGEGLTSETLLTVTHPWYTPYSIKAGALYTGEPLALPMRVIPLTSYFDITPAGGTYRSGGIFLEIPPGAIDKPMRVYASLIPFDRAYNRDGSIEPLRLAALDLVPHALSFKKPIKVSTVIAREDVNLIEDPITLAWQDDTRTFEVLPSVKTEIEGQHVTMTLRKFGRYTAADASKGQSTDYMGRSQDADGDGRLTPGDAAFLGLLSGGPHRMSARYDDPVSGIVFEEGSGGGRFSFGDKTFDLARSLTFKAGQERARDYGETEFWEIAEPMTLDLAAEDYGFDCQMIVATYNLHRSAFWQRVELGEEETALIATIFDQHRPKEKSSPLFLNVKDWKGRSASDTHLAVIPGETGLQVFVRQSSAILARPLYLHSAACPAGTGSSLGEAVSAAVGEARNKADRQQAMINGFHFGGSAKEPQGVNKWGTLTKGDVKLYLDKECQGTEQQVWNYAINRDEVSEDGHASINTWVSEDAVGPTAINRTSGSVEWSIDDTHPYHYSDHLTASLYKESELGELPFGFLMVRLAERPCSGREAIAEPPSFVTSPLPTPDQAVQNPQGPTASDASLSPLEVSSTPLSTNNELHFTSLDGITLVNVKALGTPLEAWGVVEDDKQTPLHFTREGETLRIDILEGPGPREIHLKGTAGTLHLFADLKPTRTIRRSRIKPTPSDGLVDIANGMTQETYYVPGGAVDITGRIEEHTAALAKQPTTILAIRTNEVVVAGEGIVASPRGGTWMDFTQPNGDSFAGTVPSWGYEVGAQPPTHTNVWAPILFRCIGLPPRTEVSVTLRPSKSQTIESFHDRIACGAAADFAIIARYKSSEVGPQKFNTTVERLAP